MEMQAVFIAHGPFTTDMKAHRQSRSKSGGNWYSVGGDAYIMKAFRNVELYDLVINLLGVVEYAASTNGTLGFWERYL